MFHEFRGKRQNRNRIAVREEGCSRKGFLRMQEKVACLKTEEKEPEE